MENYFLQNKKDERITETLTQYFLYLSELTLNDFNFFIITSNKNLYLLNIELVLVNLPNYIEEKKLPINLEYALLRYY